MVNTSPSDGMLNKIGLKASKKSDKNKLKKSKKSDSKNPSRLMQAMMNTQ